MSVCICTNSPVFFWAFIASLDCQMFSSRGERLRRHQTLTESTALCAVGGQTRFNCSVRLPSSYSVKGEQTVVPVGWDYITSTEKMFVMKEFSVSCCETARWKSLSLSPSLSVSLSLSLSLSLSVFLISPKLLQDEEHILSCWMGRRAQQNLMSCCHV